MNGFIEILLLLFLLSSFLLTCSSRMLHCIRLVGSPRGLAWLAGYWQ